jgi:hypothetical protein
MDEPDVRVGVSPFEAGNNPYRSFVDMVGQILGRVEHPQKALAARSGSRFAHAISMQIVTRSELEQLANALLEPLFPAAKGVRLLGISLSSLVAEEREREREFSLSLL